MKNDAVPFSRGAGIIEDIKFIINQLIGLVEKKSRKIRRDEINR